MQFKDAARQVDPEDIADVLEEQAADAEDAAGVEEGTNTEVTAAFKAQAAAERQNLAADAKAKAAPNLIQADPALVAAQNGGDVAGEVTHSVTDVEGATKDVQEPDLDLSHADSAPGTIHMPLRSMVKLVNMPKQLTYIHPQLRPLYRIIIQD